MTKVTFLRRQFPSANMVILHGARPVLVDSGFGSDARVTHDLIAQHLDPAALTLLVNTHYHCDHAGGNYALQQRYKLPIAAHHWEAQAINHRDRDACSAEWLSQGVEPYTVQHLLRADDVISTGDYEWQVIHTPGHSLGHICLYNDGTLIAGDTIHADDVAWLNVFREGIGAIYRMLDTIERLSKLPIRESYSGHGPKTENPQLRFDAAKRRYEKWIANPQKVGWHAIKRIFTYGLMLEDGLPEADVKAYLLACPWYMDYCRFVFDADPVDFITDFLAELKRSGAAQWRNGVIFSTAPYSHVDRQWLASLKRPDKWPQ